MSLCLLAPPKMLCTFGSWLEFDTSTSGYTIDVVSPVDCVESETPLLPTALWSALILCLPWWSLLLLPLMVSGASPYSEVLSWLCSMKWPLSPSHAEYADTLPGLWGCTGHVLFVYVDTMAQLWVCGNAQISTHTLCNCCTPEADEGLIKDNKWGCSCSRFGIRHCIWWNPWTAKYFF